MVAFLLSDMADWLQWLEVVPDTCLVEHLVDGEKLTKLCDLMLQFNRGQSSDAGGWVVCGSLHSVML